MVQTVPTGDQHDVAEENWSGAFTGSGVIHKPMHYVIRGHKVMLDVDLAELYGVTTKRLNEQVKRNRKRFPPDFMFRLTAAGAETVMSLRSQIATLRWQPPDLPIET